MPLRAKRPCGRPGCPALTSGRYCDAHLGEADARRGTAAERGYDHRWRAARAIFLAQNPLCVECLESNRTTAATVVDHKQPHRGDPALFWDRRNWQSLCAEHHGKKTAAGE